MKENEELIASLLEMNPDIAEDETSNEVTPGIDVDFSEVDINLRDRGRHWTPVRKDDNGPYGNGEMQLASANYFNQGDVGNDIWMAERRLPLGDYGNSMIGISGNVMMLFGFEDHPTLAPKPSRNAAEEFMSSDPAVRWAMDEYQELNEGDPSSENAERMTQLASFIAEAKEYHQRLYEDKLVTVPDWAMDVLNRAVEIGLTYDPQIVPESGEPSTLKSNPVSVTPMPRIDEVKKFNDVVDDYVIEAEGQREWCIALVDGEKTMGPCGRKTGVLKLGKPANVVYGREAAEFRHQTFMAMLRDYGFTVGRNDENGQANFTFTYPHQVEDLAKAEQDYGRMASEIARISSLNATILTHREDLIKELNREALKQICEADSEISAFLKAKSGKKHVALITKDEILSLLDDQTIDNLAAKVHQKVSQPTYLLQVKDTWGWQVVRISKNEEVADRWRSAINRDLPYFFGTPQQQYKLGQPSKLRPPNYDEASEEARANVDLEVELATNLWLEEDNINNGEISRLIPHFNAGHRVKVLASRADRLTGWLIPEMPLNSQHLKLARQALDLIGKKIVRARMSNNDPTIKFAFRKLQKAIEGRLDRWTPEESDMTLNVIERIANGFVDLSFDTKLIPTPKDKKLLTSLVKYGYVLPQEQGREYFVAPELHFNKVFLNHEEVFSICKGFRPTKENQARAKTILKAQESPTDSEV